MKATRPKSTKRRGAILWAAIGIAFGLAAGSTLLVLSYRNAWPVLAVVPVVTGLIGVRVGYAKGYGGRRLARLSCIALVSGALLSVAPFGLQRYRLHRVRTQEVPVYPQARETGFDVALVPHNSFPGFTATYETDAAPEQVLRFFRAGLRERGWEEIAPVRLLGTTVFRFDQPGYRLQLHISHGGAYSVDCLAFNLLYRREHA